MNRTLIALIALMAGLGLAALGLIEPQVRGANLSPSQSTDGCSACHPKLSDQVPDDHFKPKLAAVKNCLACHAMSGAATAFAWTVHRSHFTALGPAAQCMFCHQIDAGGAFRVMGVDTGPEIKTTMDAVAKMPPYYESWATSTYLDRRHGERSVTCTSCHGEAFPTAAPKKEQCFTCHGTYAQLAEQSPFHYGPLYPHFGDGSPINCSECHKAHTNSVLACNMCHDFGDKVP